MANCIFCNCEVFLWRDLGPVDNYRAAMSVAVRYQLAA